MRITYSTHWFASTRRHLVWLTFAVVLLMSPALMNSFERGHRPAVTGALIALVLTPFLIARRCWRFLEEAEQRNPVPTPEMEFIFNLAAGVLIALGGVVMVVVSLV